jgi:RNA polymerase sigma-70 factor, ECF subfamily
VPRERDDRRDRQLFGDLAAGRPSALAEVYDRHQASLFRHAYALTRGRADAEDLVQHVFVDLAAMGPELLGVRQPASYLHRMLHTTWLDGQRRFITGERMIEHVASVTPQEFLPVSGESIDLGRAIAALPAAQREVINLRVVEGFSFREIGGLTGVSMFTAAARYRLAIGRMKRQLDPDIKDAKDRS